MRAGISHGPSVWGKGTSLQDVRTGLHGQSHCQKPKPVGWTLAESPCSVCSQPGHRAVQEPAGGIGYLHGDGDGPRIGPGLVQDCPVRALLGQGLRAPEGRKRGPGPGARDNAGVS